MEELLAASGIDSANEVVQSQLQGATQPDGNILIDPLDRESVLVKVRCFTAFRRFSCVPGVRKPYLGGFRIPNAVFRVVQAVEGRLAVPKWQEFVSTVTKLYTRIKANVHGGDNASYIPILEEADRNWFGISVCTVDGQRFDIGDVDVDFSIQSCVKPLMYAAAIEDLGLERVHKHVGIEPSGLAFNEVSLNAENLPHNPMINPGTWGGGAQSGPAVNTTGFGHALQ